MTAMIRCRCQWVRVCEDLSIEILIVAEAIEAQRMVVVQFAAIEVPRRGSSDWRKLRYQLEACLEVAGKIVELLVADEEQVCRLLAGADQVAGDIVIEDPQEGWMQLSEVLGNGKA